MKDRTFKNWLYLIFGILLITLILIVIFAIWIESKILYKLFLTNLFLLFPLSFCISAQSEIDKEAKEKLEKHSEIQKGIQEGIRKYQENLRGRGSK